MSPLLPPPPRSHARGIRAGAVLPFLVASTLLAAACAPAGSPESGGDAAGDTPAATADTLPVRPADRVLFRVEGLDGPEAVKYDPAADVYVIGNFGPDDDPEANDGYLTRVAAEDGAVLERRWAVGSATTPLQQPRGMALSGDTLWVADARGLHAFHRESGAALDFVDLTALEPGFLNDVAVGADGTVYVTDTGASRLVRLVPGGGEIVAEGPALGSPNGVTLDPGTGRLVLVPWREGGDSLRVWDPATGELSILARTPGGSFDGVEPLDGRLVVASQADSALHLVEGETGRPFQRVPGRPADIAVDTRRGRIAVPYIALDRVDVFAGPGG